MPSERSKNMAFEPNDICEYEGQAVRLLFPAPPPLNGWIAVEIVGSGGGTRHTGDRIHVKDESKLQLYEVRP
jgi:hypothetical protein